MLDEEHYFESKVDAGASKTYPQQAGTIKKNDHIIIKACHCKFVEKLTSKTGKHGHAKCNFVAIDIFTAKKLEDIVPSSHNCDVPLVTRIDYQLIDISEDGFVSLLTENGNTKGDLRLPTDENLLRSRLVLWKGRILWCLSCLQWEKSRYVLLKTLAQKISIDESLLSVCCVQEYWKKELVRLVICWIFTTHNNKDDD